MKLDSSLPCSQELAAGPYPESDVSIFRYLCRSKESVQFRGPV